MNDLAARLGIRFPLIQAGMGGIAGPELAAEVSQAGAGGVIGLYRMRGGQIREVLQRTRALTTLPFGVNLIPELVHGCALAEQVGAVLEASGTDVFFVFYGLPGHDIAQEVSRAGRQFLVMVGDTASAHAAAALGADAVILQGIEAGGHLLGSLRLQDLIADVVASRFRIPFLGAGGIGSGHAFRRIHAHGAAGCLCGTLFLATYESTAHPSYKTRVVDASAEDTVITDIFDIGWPARRHRVLRNALTALPAHTLGTSFIAEATVLGRRHPIPRYSAMVPTAATRGAVDEMAMYCGLSATELCDIVSARTRVERFIAEFSDPSPLEAPQRDHTPRRSALDLTTARRSPWMR